MPVTDHLPHINLFTRSGARAATVATLPWKYPPEGLMWGSRTFFRQADGRYVEGLMWWVSPELYVEPTAEQCGMFEGETLKVDVAADGDLKIVPPEAGS